MPSTPAPTRDELKAQKLEINRQLAELDLAPVLALQTLLNESRVTTLVADITDMVADIGTDNPAVVQANNMLSVLRQVPLLIDREVIRLQELTQ